MSDRKDIGAFYNRLNDIPGATDKFNAIDIRLILQELGLKLVPADPEPEPRIISLASAIVEVAKANHDAANAREVGDIVGGAVIESNFMRANRAKKFGGELA